MARSFPTLQDIRAAQGLKQGYDCYLLLGPYLFRPVGYLLAWGAARAGISSEGVSWLSGLVGLGGCVLLVSGAEGAIPAGIGLLLLFNVLDCVDGSLARTLKTQNPYGRFLDSMCGGVVDLGFWAVVGIMAFRHPQLLHWPDPFGYGSIFWLVIGGVVCFLYLFLGLLENWFDHLLRPFLKETNTVGCAEAQQVGSEPELQKPWPLRLIVATNLRVRETHYVLLLVAYLADIVDLLLGGYLLFYSAYNFSLLAVYVKRGRQIRRASSGAQA